MRGSQAYRTRGSSPRSKKLNANWKFREFDRDRAPLAYEVCPDGLTVADLNTRLLWEKKVEGGSDLTCLTELHGVDSTCSWPQANGEWIDAVNAEDGTGYAGFDDWRVANIKELVGIVDYSKAFPAIHAAFGPTAPTAYWSATFVDDDFGWAVFFSNGGAGFGDKFNTAHVRAIRDGLCAD